MKLNTEFKLKLQLWGFIITSIGLFIIVRSLRHQFFSLFTQRAYLWNLNFIAFIGIILLFFSGAISFRKENRLFLLLPLISLFFPLRYSISIGNEFGYFIVFTVDVIVALYLLYAELSPSIRKPLLRYFMIVLNVIMILLIVRAILDIAFDRSIAKWLCTFMTADKGYTDFAYPVSREFRRPYTLYGHPLINAALLNFTYILNIAWNEHQQPILPSWLCCILFISGAVCCGSKTGITVAILITILAYYNNIKILISAFVALLIAIISGLANNIIDRFFNTSLLTGRAEALSSLLADTQHPIYLFKGNGHTYPIAALEFPLISMAVTYGLIFSLIIIGLIFIYVSKKLFHKRAIRSWLLWCLCFAEINTFSSSLAICNDETLMYCFLTMVFLNIAALNSKEESY